MSMFCWNFGVQCSKLPNQCPLCTCYLHITSSCRPLVHNKWSCQCSSRIAGILGCNAPNYPTSAHVGPVILTSLLLVDPLCITAIFTSLILVDPLRRTRAVWPVGPFSRRFGRSQRGSSRSNAVWPVAPFSTRFGRLSTRLSRSRPFSLQKVNLRGTGRLNCMLTCVILLTIEDELYCALTYYILITIEDELYCALTYTILLLTEHDEDELYCASTYIYSCVDKRGRALLCSNTYHTDNNRGRALP